VRKQIVDALTSFRHPTTGEPMVDRCHLREDLYTGPQAAAAPDIVIDWKDMEYWSYDVITGGNKIVSANLQTRSGGHRQNGIFIAAGAGVRQATITGASVVDVAPTVLRILGLPQGADMDGRALADMLVETPPPPPAVGAVEPPRAAAESSYTPEEEEAVRERLRQLGYL
jgi:predicted AlkP superfamily phosphohydrolase/phosphomutase